MGFNSGFKGLILSFTIRVVVNPEYSKFARHLLNADGNYNLLHKYPIYMPNYSTVNIVNINIEKCRFVNYSVRTAQ
jgi:hypothetical protein